MSIIFNLQTRLNKDQKKIKHKEYLFFRMKPFDLLYALSEDTPSLKTISYLTKISDTTISHLRILLNNLIELDLVMISGNPSNKRRGVIYTLTSQGEELANEIKLFAIKLNTSL